MSSDVPIFKALGASRSPLPGPVAPVAFLSPAEPFQMVAHSQDHEGEIHKSDFVRKKLHNLVMPHTTKHEFDRTFTYKYLLPYELSSVVDRARIPLEC